MDLNEMRQKWIEADARPVGIGRAERERAFWERVASGRSAPRPSRSACREDAEGPWESAQVAVVTMLTVVVFGLGWVTLELEDVPRVTGYDWSAGLSDSTATPQEISR